MDMFHYSQKKKRKRKEKQGGGWGWGTATFLSPRTCPVYKDSGKSSSLPLREFPGPKKKKVLIKCCSKLPYPLTLVLKKLILELHIRVDLGKSAVLF